MANLANVPIKYIKVNEDRSRVSSNLKPIEINVTALGKDQCQIGGTIESDISPITGTITTLIDGDIVNSITFDNDVKPSIIVTLPEARTDITQIMVRHADPTDKPIVYVSENKVDWFEITFEGEEDDWRRLKYSIPVNSSIEFTTSIPTWIEINDNVEMDISDGQFGTVEFFIKFKPDLPNEIQAITDKGDLGTQQYYMLMDARSGTPQIKFKLGNSHEITVDRTKDIIGRWVHMAFVMDGSKIIYYEDGELIHQEEGLNYFFSRTSIRLTFGRTSDRQMYYGNFLYNYHRVWNVARSQTEIKDNAYYDVDPTNPDLRGYWVFNNRKPKELTGGLHEGYLKNNVTFPLDVPVETLVNNSLEFIRDQQSYVSISHHDSLTINGPMTLEFWVKMKSPLPNDFQVLVDKGNIGTTQFYVLHEGRNGNNQIKYRFGTGPERTFNRPVDIIGNWTHMAFVWDGTNMFYYENGLQVAQESFPVSFSPNTMPLTFGRMSAGGAYLNAYLDNVRLWNVSRSAEEINNNKDIPIDGNTQGLIGLWEFDEGAGIVVNDLSVNNNDGIITNAVFSTDASPTILPTITGPIILGETKIDNIFLGEQQILNVYLGDKILTKNPTKPLVQVTSLTNSVRLDWPVTENTTSWNIYRSEVKGTLGEKMSDGSFIKVNTYTDTTAIGGTTYYYTVESKNADNNKATKAEQVTGFPYSELVYENKLVDFIGYTGWTVYGTPEVTSDFGNVATLQGGDRLKIDTAERLRFYLPVGVVGSANAGGIIKANIAGKNEYTMEYEIRFDTGFPWSKGGKVPGLSGGVGYTGGEPATAGDGFSVRMMWREDGRIIPYVYHYKQTDQFGDTFGLTLGYFTNTKAHKVKYYVKLNTPGGMPEGIADGILRIWIDDILVLDKTDMCYRTDQSQIDTAHISIFPGGSTADWNMTADGYIRLSYVQWQ
jgi:hypothetical protein